MFTIQFKTVAGTHSMQTFDSTSRTKLIKHLAHFDRPFVAVFEGANVITKAVRSDLQRLPVSTLSSAAKDFIVDRT